MHHVCAARDLAAGEIHAADGAVRLLLQGVEHALLVEEVAAGGDGHVRVRHLAHADGALTSVRTNFIRQLAKKASFKQLVLDYTKADLV